MSGIVDVDCGTKVGNAINPSDDDRKKKPFTTKTLFYIVGVGLALLFLVLGGVMVFIMPESLPITGGYDLNVNFSVVEHTIGGTCTMRVIEITHAGGEPVENISTLYILPYLPEGFEFDLVDRVVPVYERSIRHFREGEKLYLYLGVDGKFHVAAEMPCDDDFVDFPDGDYMVSVEDARHYLGIATYSFDIKDSHTLLVYDDRSINDALSSARRYESILVYGDLYKERLCIDKPIRIYAIKNASIDGGNLGAVVLITASNVCLQGFTIRNSGSGGFIDGGVVIQSPAQNVKIIDNDIYRCSSGVWIWQSNANEILDNYIHNNDQNGIWLQVGHDNNIRYNVLRDNKYGVYVDDSTHNYIVENIFSSNKRYGIYIPDWVNLNNVCEYNELGNDNHEYGNIVTRD